MTAVKLKKFVPDISVQEAKALLAIKGGADVWDYTLAKILRNIQRRGLRNLLDIGKTQMDRRPTAGQSAYFGAILKKAGERAAISVLGKPAAQSWLAAIGGDAQTTRLAMQHAFDDYKTPPPAKTVVREWTKWRIVHEGGKFQLEYNSTHTMGSWLDHCEHDPVPAFVKRALKEFQKP